MRIQRAKFAVYNARAINLMKRWQEHRVPCGDVDAIAGPQPDIMAALLGYEPEAIPLGLEDSPLVVRDSCFSFCPGLRVWDQPLLRPWCQCHHKTAPTPTTATAIGTTSRAEFSIQARRDTQRHDSRVRVSVSAA